MRKVDHLIFSTTDEVERFTERAIEHQLDSQIKCDCCIRPRHKNDVKYFADADYYVCKDCWTNNKNRAILDIHAVYKDNSEVIPYTLVNDFFKGYWE